MELDYHGTQTACDNQSGHGQSAERALSDLSATLDGAMKPLRRPQTKSRTAQKTTAIFIHAGAGFHSVDNEKVHLAACSEAARLAMRFLKAGATATEAVEAAIRALEDTEITNSGFGSNLTIEGNVECDATIVDHLGRSGACGAVPFIKNPISLAKLILDESNQPLSLRRVPPNILVGKGATEFAREQKMPIIPKELMISKNAKDRYIRWCKDLMRAEMKKVLDKEGIEAPAAQEEPPAQIPLPDHGDHVNAILTGTWNEGQPDSPQPTPGSPFTDTAPLPVSAQGPSHVSNSPSTVVNGSKAPPGSPLDLIGDMRSNRGRGSPKKRTRLEDGRDDVAGTTSQGSIWKYRGAIRRLSPGQDGQMDLHHDRKTAQSDLGKVNSRQLPQTQMDGRTTASIGEDMITDTIGAIAVDQSGNIAAGSSSGGIGMKYSGRIGPAALVGIGTAVLPANDDDADQKTVAAVTSGTGEHMATTMAAYTCAQRLYHNARSGPGGQLVEEDDDARLMESVILDDFLGHPGVRDQHSRGAIGVMAVKKIRTGFYLYFAHSTDSFALASMSSDDKEPKCVMSRLSETGVVAQGARKIGRQ